MVIDGFSFLTFPDCDQAGEVPILTVLLFGGMIKEIHTFENSYHENTPHSCVKKGEIVEITCSFVAK